MIFIQQSAYFSAKKTALSLKVEVTVADTANNFNYAGVTSMMILTNRPVENGTMPKLFPSAVQNTVQSEEQKGSVVSSYEDSLSISPEAAVKLLEPKHTEEEADKKQDPASKGKNGEPLSEEEKEVVKTLKKRDAEVKTHEQAHIAAGGQHVRGGATFSYQSGPDGGRYAVGGEVNIDTSAVPNDPDATIRKMQAVRAAANAPADPSGQDRSVAASATSTMAKAQADKATGSSSTSSGEASTEKKQPEKQSTDKSEPSKSSHRTSAISNYTQNSKPEVPKIDIAG